MASGNTHRFSGSDWLKSRLHLDLSPLATEAADILGQVFRGIYHLPRSNWEPERWTGPMVWAYVNGSLSTFDFSHLTELVVLAHDRCVRLTVKSAGPRGLHLEFHERNARQGALPLHIPFMEDHLHEIRKNLGFGLREGGNQPITVRQFCQALEGLVDEEIAQEAPDFLRSIRWAANEAPRNFAATLFGIEMLADEAYHFGLEDRDSIVAAVAGLYRSKSPLGHDKREEEQREYDLTRLRNQTLQKWCVHRMKVELFFQDQTWGWNNRPSTYGDMPVDLRDLMVKVEEKARRSMKGHTTWPAVVCEELGEAFRAETPEDRIAELIQTAASCLSWVQWIHENRNLPADDDRPLAVAPTKREEVA